MWSKRVLAGAVILAVAALGMPAQAQSPRPVVPCKDSIGVALVDIPEARQADPRARTYVIDHVEPGARFERRLRVCNGTAAPVTVQVYAGAATIDGAAFRAVEGRQTNELSSWITVAPTQVTVPAKGEKIVPVGFAVPADATGGERYAALLVEAPAVRQPSGNSVANRVGVRVYLSVGGPQEPQSQFVVDSLQAARGADGRPVVTARVRNTGERALDMAGELTLSEGPGGLSAGPFAATVGTTLAVGATAPVEVVLDEAVRGGPWLATITMRSGLLERAAKASITFPDNVGTSAAPVEAAQLPLAKDPGVVIPFAIGLLGLLFLLLLVVGYLSTRRKAREKAAG